HQRARNRQHLLLTAGQRARLLLPALCQARELLKNAIHVERNFLMVLAQVAAHFQVFGDRHVRENMTSFWAMSDAKREDFAGGGVRNIRILEYDAASRGR